MIRWPISMKKAGWPDLTWDDGSLAVPLARVRHQQGRLLGKMEALGFDLRAEASLTVLTSEVVKSSAIEGETPRSRGSTLLDRPPAGARRGRRSQGGDATSRASSR